MFHLIVKGNAIQASVAASARGIEHTVKTEVDSGRQTVLIAKATHEKVSAWFCEDNPDIPPYRIGSLLYFSKSEIT